MSVLIKGMEMPEGCPFCPLSHWARGTYEFAGCEIIPGKRYAMLNDKVFAVSLAKSRPDWCPLIELPPHGRLIDADEMVASVKRQTEIMREIAKEVDKLKPIATSKELDDVDIVAIAETVEKGVLQEIANAPTILEAEVEE